LAHACKSVVPPIWALVLPEFGNLRISEDKRYSLRLKLPHCARRAGAGGGGPGKRQIAHFIHQILKKWLIILILLALYSYAEKAECIFSYGIPS
jgi:hypothetical protein